MTDYSENVFHLNDYCFVFKRITVNKNLIKKTQKAT